MKIDSVFGSSFLDRFHCIIYKLSYMYLFDSWYFFQFGLKPALCWASVVFYLYLLICLEVPWRNVRMRRFCLSLTASCSSGTVSFAVTPTTTPNVANVNVSELLSKHTTPNGIVFTLEQLQREFGIHTTPSASGMQQFITMPLLGGGIPATGNASDPPAAHQTPADLSNRSRKWSHLSPRSPSTSCYHQFQRRCRTSHSMADGIPEYILWNIYHRARSDFWTSNNRPICRLINSRVEKKWAVGII